MLENVCFCQSDITAGSCSQATLHRTDLDEPLSRDAESTKDLHDSSS